MRRLNRSRVPVDEQDFSCWLDPVPFLAGNAVAPVTILFSARDGIVSEAAARIDPSTSRGPATAASSGVRYEQIESSHLGFPVNLDAYRAIA
jgi:hypothetical protein